MDAVCLSLLFLFCCQKPPKNFFSCLHVERKKKGRQYRTHFNSSTGKVIHCTAYLWMFSCIYTFWRVFTGFNWISFNFSTSTENGESTIRLLEESRNQQAPLEPHSSELKCISTTFSTAVCVSLSLLFVYIDDIYAIAMSFLTSTHTEQKKENNPFLEGKFFMKFFSNTTYSSAFQA